MAELSSREPSSPTPRFHHVGIQTADIDTSITWYEDFLGCRLRWSLTEFSELTRSRLPGIRRLVELTLSDVRIHLFERPGRPAAGPGDSVNQLQHLCLAVPDPDELPRLRRRWIQLYDSGRYRFASSTQPTEVVTDADGVRSFYALDVNGVELEFTYQGEAS